MVNSELFIVEGIRFILIATALVNDQFRVDCTHDGIFSDSIEVTRESRPGVFHGLREIKLKV